MAFRLVFAALWAAASAVVAAPAPRCIALPVGALTEVLMAPSEGGPDCFAIDQGAGAAHFTVVALAHDDSAYVIRELQLDASGGLLVQAQTPSDAEGMVSLARPGTPGLAYLAVRLPRGGGAVRKLSFMVARLENAHGVFIGIEAVPSLVRAQGGVRRGGAVAARQP